MLNIKKNVVKRLDLFFYLAINAYIPDVNFH